MVSRGERRAIQSARCPEVYLGDTANSKSLSFLIIIIIMIVFLMYPWWTLKKRRHTSLSRIRFFGWFGRNFYRFGWFFYHLSVNKTIKRYRFFRKLFDFLPDSIQNPSYPVFHRPGIQNFYRKLGKNVNEMLTNVSEILERNATTSNILLKNKLICSLIFRYRFRERCYTNIGEPIKSWIWRNVSVCTLLSSN